MRTSRLWQVVLFFAAAAIMLVLAGGGSAHSLATCTANNDAQLEAAVHNASCTVIQLKAATTAHKRYFTDNASDPTKGYEIDHTATIQGPVNSSGNCTAQAKTIVDGDPAPGGAPGHNGPEFTVGADNVQFKCFTMAFGTAGVVSDGFDGLNVNKMNFVGNGRDLNQTVDLWDGDGIWVNDGNGVKVNDSTFSGQGRAGLESEPTGLTNDLWSVKKSVFKNMNVSCLLLGNNTNLLMGELVSGKPANGNTCSVVGVGGSPDPGIFVDDQAVGGANILYANTVFNSHGDCFSVNGDDAVFKGNVCITSQQGRGVYFNGDDIVADNFSTTISSGHTNGNCIESDGDRLKLSNFKCGATRDGGVFINGLDSTVTNGQVKQSINTCLYDGDDGQIWNNVSCGHVTSGDGLQGGGADSSFTKITIGDVNGSCALLNNSGEHLTNLTCNSSGSYGIEMNDDDLVVNGFTIGSSGDHCVLLDSGFSNGQLKTGKCGSVLNGAHGVQDNQPDSIIDGVNVVSASGNCFDVNDDGVTLKNSTGQNCGTGGSGLGIDWTGAGTAPHGATITNNTIGESNDANLSVSVVSGDFSVTNNRFHNAANGDCVVIGFPDTLIMTGNKIQGCQNGGANIDVATDPHVNSNIINDASGLGGDATLYVQCDTSCDGAQVNLNQLDGGGNEQPGIRFNNNTGGDQTFQVNTNTITNISGHGIELQGDGGGTLLANVVQNSGDADEFFGILVATNDNVVRQNNVSFGHDNGIEVTGDGNALDHNNSHDNDEDGIHFLGSNNASVSDTTTNNLGEGFEDDGAAGNTVDGLTSSGNREDCTGLNNGTYGGTTANNCADGSDFSEDGMIDKPVHR